MNFFRAHSRATRGAGAIGFVFLFASLVAGCALYDAFQNPAEGGNNGGDSCDGSDLTLEAAPDACFQECNIASDVPILTEYQSNLGNCAEAASCYAVFERPTSSNVGSSVCIDKQTGDECAVREMTEYLRNGATYQPCNDQDAEYHVTARPGGGFVFGGCAAENSNNGYRLVWFDSLGGADTTGGQPTRFFDSSDDMRNGRLRGLVAASDDSAGASRVVGVFERGTTEISYASGVFRRSQTDIESIAAIDARNVDCGASVGFVGGFETFAFSTCYDDGGISVYPITLDSSDVLSVGSPRVWQPSTESSVRLEDLTLDGSAGEFGVGDEAFRLVGRGGSSGSDSDTLYFGSFSVEESGAGAQTVIQLGSGIQADLADPGITTVSATGVPPEPSIKAVANGNAGFFAGQGGDPLRPILFSRAGGADAQLDLGADGEPRELVMDFAFLGGLPAPGLEAQPEADLSGGTNVGLVLLTRVDPTGNPADMYARVYGMTSQFNVQWTREIKPEGGFAPQHMAISADKRVAVVGRDSGNAPRLMFLDALGRGFCEHPRLEEIVGSEGGTE